MSIFAMILESADAICYEDRYTMMIVTNGKVPFFL